ncbi:MAG: hypothetical protein HW406_130 [Candidatus Brocadiaceae bacterium]|nr:hypothetical protein [Candidatus Brocadiaceae bacterium]
MEKYITEQIPTFINAGHIKVQERLRHFDKTEKFAVITTEGDRLPYISLVAFALTSNMKGVVFTSKKTTRQFRNILTDNYVAILIDNRSVCNDCMNIEAISIVGTANAVMRGKKWLELSNILIAKHPSLADFIHDPTTSLIYVKMITCIPVNNIQTVSQSNTQMGDSPPSINDYVDKVISD